MIASGMQRDKALFPLQSLVYRIIGLLRGEPHSCDGDCLRRIVYDSAVGLRAAERAAGLAEITDIDRSILEIGVAITPCPSGRPEHPHLAIESVLLYGELRLPLVDGVVAIRSRPNINCQNRNENYAKE